MNVAYIEPCCIEKQLPPILREYGVVPFQTNGDVTFEKIIKAVSSLAGNEITIYLMAKVVSVDMMRNLAWLARRGWLKTLHVLTKEEQSKDLHNEIAEVCNDLHCYHSDRIEEDMLLIKGEEGIVVVQGLMTSGVGAAHRFYTAYFSTAETSNFFMMTKTALSLFRNEDIPTAEEQTTEETSVENVEQTEEKAESPEETTEETTSTAKKTSKKKSNK